MVFLDIAPVCAHQGFQESREALDPQELRDHLAITDPKDPWDHEETRVMKVLVEEEVSRDPRGLKGPPVLLVRLETKVKRVLGVDKVPPV